MKLLSLRLQNFRNHEDFLFEPEDLTIIVGPNGVGKTNIIEAARLLSVLKSFRARRQAETIQWGKNYFRLEAAIEKENKKFQLDIYQDSLVKSIKINGVEKRISEALGFLKTTLFTPEDMGLCAGAPALRRRWLDILLSQKDLRYLIKLVACARVVKSRNQVLARLGAGISEMSELEFWNAKLLELGSYIRDRRAEAYNEFNQSASAFYHQISGKTQSLILKPKVRELTKSALDASLASDIKFAATSIGPHHDDFSFELASRDIASFGSRGECRSAILAIKMVESLFLSAENDPPVLLLDDILSELDASRRSQLFTLFDRQQVIMTVVDINQIDESIRKKAKIIRLM